MITIKINSVKHSIPTEWGDVTYSQYVGLIDVETTLLYYIHFFTGIPRDTLEAATLKNLETISLALSFLTIPPKFESKAVHVGPYPMPADVTIESLGQFEDLRGLLTKLPEDITTKENQKIVSELYLEACAIYCQKIRDGKYNNLKVSEVKEELKGYSCIEVIQTGSFFLFRPLTLSMPTPTRSQIVLQRMKKLVQDWPGYQKTLDFLLHSLGKQKG